MTFKKGQSGNPGGRPKGFVDFKQACQDRSMRALELLDDALGQGPSPVAIEAAKVLLSYGWGKPTQVVDLNATIKGDIAAILDGRADRARQRG
jgi:hypothetical protein